MLSILHKTDEAGAFAAGIRPLRLTGEIQHQIMIESAQMLCTTEQQAKTHHGGFKDKVFTRILQRIPTVNDLQFAAVKWADGLRGEMGIRQHDGGNLPTTVARQLSAAIGLKFIPEHMRASGSKETLL